jgi:hypothetical protein
VRFVILLENENKFIKEIAEALHSVDPKIQLKVFPSLESFAEWLKVFMQSGPAAIELAGEYPKGIAYEPVTKGEKHVLSLVISKREFLGKDALNLLKRTKDLFIKRGLCTKEDPTGFVLTVFEDPNFNSKDFHDPVVNNIIYKPFDRLILAQHLTYAVDGRHPPSKYSIANIKTTAFIEMLKQVEVNSASEIGFKSTSDREIPIGSVCKYYASNFKSDRHRSVIGVVRKCRPHPAIADQYQIEVHYFSIDHKQIQNIRKNCYQLSAKNPDDSWNFDSTNGAPEYTYLAIDPEEAGPPGIFAQINKRFSNLRCIEFENFGDFWAELDPEASLKQGIFGKPFGNSAEVTLKFDKSGAIYMGVDEKTPVTTMFGKTPEEWKNKAGWFLGMLEADPKEKFKKIFKNLENPELFTFSAKVGENKFLVKIASIEALEKEVKVTFKDLTDPEKVDYLKSVAKIPEKIDFLIISHRFAGDNPTERWSGILDQLEKRTGSRPILYLTSKRDYNDTEEKELAKAFQDVWFKPIDKLYMFHKLKAYFPGLREVGDPIALKPYLSPEVIKAANPVRISEISEAGFIMNYSREIDIGKFREIVLWQPYEIGAPELLATCNYSESKGKEGVDNHFVFFGTSDHFLKNLRKWILSNYVNSKEKGS